MVPDVQFEFNLWRLYMLLLIHIFETRKISNPQRRPFSRALLIRLMRLNGISRISTLKETLSCTDRVHQMHLLVSTDLEEHTLETQPAWITRCKHIWSLDFWSFDHDFSDHHIHRTIRSPSWRGNCRMSGLDCRLSGERWSRPIRPERPASLRSLCCNSSCR
jgi:hypothetical protein